MRVLGALRSASALILCLGAVAMGTDAQVSKAQPGTPIRLFDGRSLFGWDALPDGSWEVKQELLRPISPPPAVLRSRTQWKDFELTAEILLEASGRAQLAVRAPSDQPFDEAHGIVVQLDGSDRQWPAGSLRGIARANRPPRVAERWATLIVRAEGGAVRVSYDGRELASTHRAPIDRGVIALRASGGMAVRRMELRPLNMVALFNGRDLSGWKAVEGQSQYSVTPEGALNIRGGRGDLQTEQSYGDFVLQLQVFVNGERLNSGIFFRANPGALWSGYEAQIRNQWQGDDRTKPVDFGTGGIYNRQPARRVVSSDREWFTMTICAVGKHLATWVNGEQVTDWEDSRPENQANARSGARTAAGVISLQGHDPSTDLSFRAIVLGDLSSGKR